jgi:hypothetical protein
VLSDAFGVSGRAMMAALGPDHPTTAIRPDNLAATLGSVGRHTEALPLRRRSLAITRRTGGRGAEISGP